MRPSCARAGSSTKTPEKLIFREYWNLIWDGQLLEAVLHAKESGLDGISEGLGGWRTTHRARPGYLTHWGEAFKCAATMLGLPPGEYPYSRPAASLPARARQRTDPCHLRALRAHERIRRCVGPSGPMRTVGVALISDHTTGGCRV